MRNNGKQRKNARRSSAIERIEGRIESLTNALAYNKAKHSLPRIIDRLETCLKNNQECLANTRAKM